MYPPRLAEALRRRGHDAVAVKSRPDLLGRADATLLALATREGRSLVTENSRDFAQLVAALSERGQSHAGVILVHPARFPRSAEHTTPFLDAIDGLAGAWPGGLGSVMVWLQLA